MTLRTLHYRSAMYYYYYLSEKGEEEKCKEIDQPAVKSDTLHTHTHTAYIPMCAQQQAVLKKEVFIKV